MILGLFKSRMILAELSSEYGISKSTFNNVSNTVKIKYRLALITKDNYVNLIGVSILVFTISNRV